MLTRSHSSRTRYVRAALLLALAAHAPGVDAAAAQPDTARAAGARTDTGTQPGGTGTPVVLAVKPYPDTTAPTVSLGGRVMVRTSGVDTARAAGRVNASKLVLYLDGRPARGEYAVPLNSAETLWEVALRRTDAGRETWERVLAMPSLAPREVRVGLGPEDGPEFSWREPKPELDILLIRERWFYGGSFALLLALIGFLALAVTTGIIRDSVPAGLPGRQRPYSLARSQMALWLFLVTAAFLGIWAVTGDFRGIITAEALTLLGIGTGTTLGARAVEQAKCTRQEETTPGLAGLRARQDSLRAQASRNPAALSTLQAALDTTSTDLAAAEMAADPHSPPRRNFLLDILTEGGEIALHRFQIVIWTVVLAVIFVLAARRTLTLPQFDATLLALMGISGGTYLGFKIIEKQT